MPIVSITTSASELIGRSRTRISLTFKNEDVTNSVFLKQEREITPTVSSTIHDIKLLPGEAVSLLQGEDGAEAIQDRWTAISSAGTVIVSVLETEEIIR